MLKDIGLILLGFLMLASVMMMSDFMEWFSQKLWKR